MYKRYSHKENCTSLVRDSFIDFAGRQVIVTGIHSYEWSVVIKTDNTITTYRFESRIKSIAFVKLLKKRI